MIKRYTSRRLLLLLVVSEPRDTTIFRPVCPPLSAKVACLAAEAVAMVTASRHRCRSLYRDENFSTSSWARGRRRV